MMTETPSAENAELSAQSEPQTDSVVQETTAETKAPEAFELTLPEGSLIDQDTFNEFATFVKESNVSQEQAQALSALGEKMLAKQHEQQAAERQAWLDSAQADKEFGGDKFNENAALARKAIETFGTPELKQALDASGIGNHPELIRAFYRIGKAISEDRVVTGGIQSAPKSVESSFYPSMNR